MVQTNDLKIPVQPRKPGKAHLAAKGTAADAACGAAKRAARGRGRPSGRDGRGADEILIDVASELFARQGYDSVSTRQIAKQARVNLSAIGYHFGGKEALYLACIEAAIDAKRKYREKLVDAVAGALAEAAGRRSALSAAIHGIFQNFVSAEFLRDLVDPQLHLLMSAVRDSTVAFERVMSGHIGLLIDAWLPLVAAATGQSEDSEETQLCAITILNLIMSASLSQPLVRRRLGRAETDAMISRLTAENISRAVLGILDLPQIAAAGEGGLSAGDSVET